MSLILHTKRLVLEPFEDADVDLAIENFTNPEVMQFAGGVMTEAAIRKEMPNWIRRGGHGDCLGVWCIKTLDTSEKLGSAALLPMPIDVQDTDWDLLVPNQMPDADIEVGYFLKRSAWGNGVATEACRRLIRFAFEETPLVEVVATFDNGNTVSERVLLKSGFTDCGTRRSYGDDNARFFKTARDDWNGA